MKKVRVLIPILFTLTFTYPMAQSPEEIIQQQLDFYNQRDLDGFMSLFAADATLVNQADGKILATGWNKVKEIYRNLFEQSPALNSELKNRIVLGNTVIDHEQISGRMGSTDSVELVVMYELKERKIHRCSVIRK